MPEGQVARATPVPLGAEGADGEGVLTGDGLAELELVECHATNNMTGKRENYFIRVSIEVLEDDLERATELRDGRKARLEDSINVTIRSADPKILEEPRLQTLRRRIKAELADIFDDEMLVKNVLIPKIQRG